jgi:hypothetical protein
LGTAYLRSSKGAVNRIFPLLTVPNCLQGLITLGASSSVHAHRKRYKFGFRRTRAKETTHCRGQTKLSTRAPGAQNTAGYQPNMHTRRYVPAPWAPRPGLQTGNPDRWTARLSKGSPTPDQMRASISYTRGFRSYAFSEVQKSAVVEWLELYSKVNEMFKNADVSSIQHALWKSRCKFHIAPHN